MPLRLIKNNIYITVLFIVLIWGPVYSEYNDTQDMIREHYLRGNLYYQQGKFKDAEDEYNQAMNLANPLKPEPNKAIVKPAVSDNKNQSLEKTADLIVAIKAQTPANVNQYLIGEDDNLRITVWQNQDLDQDVIVRPDGKISFPLVGDIQAAGLTIPGLDEVITEKLKDFIKYPEVSISLKKMGGARVMILGQVNAPGLYSVTGARTLMEAISMAGGLTRDGVPSSTVLIRGGFNAPNIQRINVAKVFKGDLRQNVILQSQDIVFVPRKFVSDLSYFLSQVLDPISKGAYTYKESQTWGVSTKVSTGQ
ncbi:MAG: polysaccharide biosynthesis/export family protein [Candidatus Omnitrophota bacterium]|nr:polysaccharide biosynthesis/export family protein [Candidatus Omnitrophota bacterium]MBU1928458.1 polysaccharide biosynthesis/export family protein [Candidatus Omnitrophota bacterium]MBU2035469.1 polysaccharide biosynthesis/export family protein [Candidatus Omnitrophota bacterium]MBU2257513.1 polysaccharide biosynthesis/export family protein [Candidatus Omnitrophota bacterium]